MKNADRTAMPHHSQSTDNVFGGLTKREMFAMNAPGMPSWFERGWSQSNCESKKYFNTYHDEFAEHCPTTYSDILPQGQAALMKAWRYAYADLMLSEDE